MIKNFCKNKNFLIAPQTFFNKIKKRHNFEKNYAAFLFIPEGFHLFFSNREGII
jgi:hypothetical protein